MFLAPEAPVLESSELSEMMRISLNSEVTQNDPAKSINISPLRGCSSDRLLASNSPNFAMLDGESFSKTRLGLD